MTMKASSKNIRDYRMLLQSYVERFSEISTRFGFNIFVLLLTSALQHFTQLCHKNNSDQSLTHSTWRIGKRGRGAGENQYGLFHKILNRHRRCTGISSRHSCFWFCSLSTVATQTFYLISEKSPTHDFISKEKLNIHFKQVIRWMDEQKLNESRRSLHAILFSTSDLGLCSYVHLLYMI